MSDVSSNLRLLDEMREKAMSSIIFREEMTSNLIKDVDVIVSQECMYQRQRVDIGFILNNREVTTHFSIDMHTEVTEDLIKDKVSEAIAERLFNCTKFEIIRKLHYE